MWKEILIGVVVGSVAFLGLTGYDLVPILLAGGILFGGYYILLQKGFLKSYDVLTYQPGTKNVITFDDIGGQNAAKLELKESLEFLLNNQSVRKMGIRPIKGILLVGPPGTGKTLLAKAAASFTDAVFIATSGSEFIEMYAGVGAQRVRNLFKRARDLALKENRRRAIIFIDELEVLGGRRGTHSSHLEYDQTLNQLLVEMDGLQNNSSKEVNILLIGATNRADMLDPALLRPGRFDRQVKVELPDKEARLQILQLHTRNKPLSPAVDLESIARETFGFSGAHLESLANEAAILAMREKSSLIEPKHFQEAIDKVIMGEKLDRKPDQSELMRIAIHESGHALISEYLRPNSVSHLTITSRGSALGYMRQNPDKDMYLYTEQYLLNQIKICLAGSVAEKLLLGTKSTGASGDFQEAVRLARQIINSGLSKLGIIWEEKVGSQLLHDTVQEILGNAEQEATHILLTYQDRLNAVAQELLQKESISGDKLREILHARQTCA